MSGDPNLSEIARLDAKVRELVDQLASAHAQIDVLKQECDELRELLAAKEQGR